MSATEIIRWLLSTGRTFPTVPRLQEALAQQVVEYAPIDRLWCGTTVLHPQAAAYLWIWQRDSPPKERELGYAQFAQLEESDSPARRLKHGADHLVQRRRRHLRGLDPRELRVRQRHVVEAPLATAIYGRRHAIPSLLGRVGCDRQR